jgi:hypothetical protein
LPEGDTLPLHTNLYGFVGFPTGGEINYTNADGSAIWVHSGRPAGRWGFDLNGKLIGFFSEISGTRGDTTNQVAIATNTVPFDTITNGIIYITNIAYLTNVEELRLTNAVSFSGKVSLNMSDLLKSRLTIVASTPAGKMNMSGVPPIVLPDLSGNWYGQKRQSNLPYNEFFTLENPDTDNTSYVVSNGEGPDYVYGPPNVTNSASFCIIVRQKKAGFAYRIAEPHAPPIPIQDDLRVIRALIGTMDLNRGKFKGRGLEGSTDFPDRITYKANLMPPMVE